MTTLYALRKYYDKNNNITSQLDQPGNFKSTSFNNVIKTGLDYYVSPKTTIGVVLGGIMVRHKGGNVGTATWLNSAGATDSAIYTTNQSNTKLTNYSINLNAKHNISATQNLSVLVRLIKRLSILVAPVM